MKRKFNLHFSVYSEGVDIAVIELDQQVFDAVDDEWRSMLYDLRTDKQIVEHVGYNLICNRIKLSQMDGWADQPNDNARVLVWPDLNQWDIEVYEITNAD